MGVTRTADRAGQSMQSRMFLAETDLDGFEKTLTEIARSVTSTNRLLLSVLVSVILALIALTANLVVH